MQTTKKTYGTKTESNHSFMELSQATTTSIRVRWGCNLLPKVCAWSPYNSSLKSLRSISSPGKVITVITQNSIPSNSVTTSRAAWPPRNKSCRFAASWRDKKKRPLSWELQGEQAGHFLMGTFWVAKKLLDAQKFQRQRSCFDGNFHQVDQWSLVSRGFIIFI